MDGGWSIAKDTAGFVGALCLFIPWARDFRTRVRLERLKGVASRLELIERLRRRHRDWLAKPKVADLVVSLIGMILITASFFISLLISARILSA
jgi:hypothetical protein